MHSSVCERVPSVFQPPLVCLLLATINLPSHLMLLHILRKIHQTTSLYLSLPRVPCIPLPPCPLQQKKRDGVDSIKHFSLCPPPHVPYLCACCVTLWQKHSNSDQHFCCTYCEWLLSLASGSIPQQLDRIVDLIATAVREVLPRDVITHKHSPVMPEWFNNFHNLFCNIFNTGVIFCT